MKKINKKSTKNLYENDFQSKEPLMLHDEAPSLRELIRRGINSGVPSQQLTIEEIISQAKKRFSANQT